MKKKKIQKNGKKKNMLYKGFVVKGVEYRSELKVNLSKFF